MGLIEKIQARLEISRLEKRYTKDRSKRATWISDAQYVDGEYVYGDVAHPHYSSPASSPSVNHRWSFMVRPLAVARESSHRA